VAQLEEPIASSSIVPMYFVAKRAREDVKVALIGQGPDELFAGYRRHLGVRYSNYWGAIPAWMRSPVVSAISALPRKEALKRGIYSLGVKDRIRRYEHVLSLLPGSEVDGLFQDGLLNNDGGDELIRCWGDLIPLMNHTDGLGGFQFLEMRSTLPDELLMFGDKLSMAHGLEARVPYLDKDLVEYVERLPARFKVRNGKQKWIHRQLCEELLPREILKRKKRGFGVNVVDDWFRGAIGGKQEEIFMDRGSLIYQYLQPSAVQAVFRGHHSGRHDHHKILFSIVLFEEWLRVQKSGNVAAGSEVMASR
jgi:asparagine synthase (glutamine-hydrolysing)